MMFLRLLQDNSPGVEVESEDQPLVLFAQVGLDKTPSYILLISEWRKVGDATLAQKSPSMAGRAWSSLAASPPPQRT